MKNKLDKKFPITEKPMNPVSKIDQVHYLKSYFTFTKYRKNQDF